MPNEIQLLTCHACGGQLTLDPKAETMTCPYCGSAYLAHDLLDDVPNCPICGRDDLVVKTSAIPRGHALYDVLRFELDNFPLPYDDDDYDDYYEDDDDDDDKRKKAAGWLWLPVVILFLLFRLGLIDFTNIDSGLAAMVVFSLALGGSLILYAFRKMGIREEKKNNEKDLRQTLKDLNLAQFTRLRPLYEKLFYCQRDGVIFLEDSQKGDKPENMREYLNKSLYNNL